MNRAGRARLEIVAAALLFSTGGAAIKATSLSGFEVAGLRSGIAGLALLAWLPAARRGFTWRGALVGLAFAGSLVLFVTANKLTTAASAIFLQSTAPLYVLLAGPWLLREKASRSDLVLMAPVAVGLLLVFLGAGPPGRTAPDPFRGNVVALSSGITWAFAIMGLRWIGADPRSSSLASVVMGNAIAFLVCLPLLRSPAAVPPADWAAIAYLGVFQVALAYVFLTAGVRRLPALQTSLLLLAEPALNPLWAWIVHGERPTALALTGGVLILGSTATKAWVDARIPPAPGITS
ncbi:MAG TPA: DMT family transporter [Anaeromyxobacteraceae bacterium]|nr:DMT family transporter [Anaeromyxobacteraceae bacterium]